MAATPVVPDPVNGSRISIATKHLTIQHGAPLREALRAFSDFVEKLEAQPASVLRNVQLLLACRFFNHVYSALLLSEAGLTADSLICERTALESLAAYLLVSVAPTYASKYENEDFPRPAEVRKLLETHGEAEDVKHLRDLYSSGSELVHVTRSNERFNTEWQTRDSARLFFGGRFHEADHLEMLRFLGAAFYWFMGGLRDQPDPRAAT
jgi:hypothetical protein